MGSGRKKQSKKPLLKVSNLTFSYGKNCILNDINFSVEPNTLIAILGPNGTGKSTLIKCLNKINTFPTGKVEINGLSINEMSIKELAKNVAYVPQNVSTSFPIDVYDVVLLGRRPYLSWNVGDNDRLIVSQVMEKLRLKEFAFRKFHTLSGGEQQKVLIAKAITQQPHLYLFDEPTSSLDLYSQYDILTEIKNIIDDKTSPCSAIIAMHDVNLASKFADKIMILHETEVYCYDKPSIALKEKTIADVYGVNAEIMQRDKSGSPIINVIGVNGEE